MKLQTVFIKPNFNFARFYSVLNEGSVQVSTEKDDFTNVTPKILNHVGKNIFKEPCHPLSFVREIIVNFFYNTFRTKSLHPIFAVFDDLPPIVSTNANFDSLLVPPDHVSRSKNDCYYLNRNQLLRSHMTAHQVELMKMGLNNFLMVGDVYRRDQIDASHYPVFHQLDAVRLLAPHELLIAEDDGRRSLSIHQTNGVRTDSTQEHFTLEASKLAEKEMKNTLEALCLQLFGESVAFRWVDAYFPFTHPSWELEILLNDKWMEVLGCGVMEHGILQNGGCNNRIGWAFGLGLERLAMILYQIPDIRLFWSRDTGFLSQFAGKSCEDRIIYKNVSIYPQCINDISFWINDEFQSNDFFDLARNVGGDVIEQIDLIDKFTNKKTGRTSHCYRITYRHMERTLTKEEVNQVHKAIENNAVEVLNVEIR